MYIKFNCNSDLSSMLIFIILLKNFCITMIIIMSSSSLYVNGFGFDAQSYVRRYGDFK